MIIATGIFAYDARLSHQFEKVTLVLPPPSSAPATVSRPKSQPRTDKSQAIAKAQPVRQVPDTITLPSQAKPNMPVTSDIIGPRQGDYSSDFPYIPGGSGSEGVLPGGSDQKKSAPPPPAPEPKTREKAAPVETTVRRSSVVLQGAAIRRVEPPYPRLALQAGVRGSVVVEVTIDEQGNCLAARALSGHPLLRDVSVKAAVGWKWKPTILNGVPVKVIGTISFNFQP